MAISRMLVQIHTLKRFRGYSGRSRGKENGDMKELETQILAAGEVRRTLADGRDIRGDIDFQNDVNALLARVEYLQIPWRSLSDLNPAPLASAIVADNTPLPVARSRALPGIERLAALVVAPRPASASRR
jgi:hypothetical protein